MTDPRAYYASQSQWSDPGKRADLFEALPGRVADICAVIQGVLIHDWYGGVLYGEPPATFHGASRETLPVSARLEALTKDCTLPLDIARPPFERSLGTCRDFALMLSAVLRHRGTPARVRCGFASYLVPDFYEDHWVCEYWHAEQGRWALADAQLDEAHRRHLEIDFAIDDLPTDRFLPAHLAWSEIVDGGADPARFGKSEAVGIWFVGVNLARDLQSLCKQEVSSWDAWREAAPDNRCLDAAAVDFCETASDLAAAANDSAPPLSAAIERVLDRPWWRS